MQLRYFQTYDKDGRNSEIELQYWDGYNWVPVPFIRCREDEQWDYNVAPCETFGYCIHGNKKDRRKITIDISEDDFKRLEIKDRDEYEFDIFRKIIIEDAYLCGELRRWE